MGAVFLAHDTRLGRKVALKVIAPEFAEDGRFRARFLRESQLAAAIDHPNIVPVYQAGEEDGTLFIAMRYVEGTDLRALLAASTEGLDPARAASLLAQVGEALDEAHAHGLVHRDVKPGNILIARMADRGEHCYLADFGLTKRASSLSGLTVTGQFMGTLDYIAPEQIEGAQLDGRADLYSLGCVAYECLTGRTPFPRDNDVAVMWAHVREAPPRPSQARAELPRAADAVIAKALAKAPSDRYGTCGELASALRVALGLEEPLRKPRVRRPTLRRPSRRALAAFGLAIVAALAAAVAAALLLMRGSSGAGVHVKPNSVVRIDPEKLRIASVASLPARLGRVSDLALDRGGAWISAGEAHLLYIGSNASKAQLRKTVPGGIDSIAVTPSGVWTVKGGRSFITRVTADSGAVERVPLGDNHGRRYKAEAVDADGRTGWVVATGGGARGLAIGRVVPGASQVTFASSRLPAGAHYTIRNGEIWALTERAQGPEITKFDLSTGLRRHSVATVPGADQLLFDGRYVWVSIPGDRAVARVDPIYKGIPRTISLNDLPVGFAFGSGKLWVAGEHGTVWSIDPQTLRKTPLKIGGYLNLIAAGPGAVWVRVVKAPASPGAAPPPE